MAWGSIRQHSAGATWENSPSHVHDDRIFGFLPSFGLNPKRKLKQSTTGARVEQPSFQVLQRKRQPARPITTSASTATTKLSPNRHPPLRPIYNDDPAFSDDPRSHPHFNDHTRTYAMQQSRHKSPHHHREPAVWHSAHAPDLSDDDDRFALLAHPLGKGQPYPGPPQSSSHSSESANSNSVGPNAPASVRTSPPSSNYSPPLSSTDDSNSSVPIKHPTSGPVNRALELTMIVNGSTPLQPPTYEQSVVAEPEPNHQHQPQQRPPAATRGISAPELHQAPAIPAQPPRPTTAPVNDAENLPPQLQKRETTGGGAGRQAHNGPQRAMELDRIDELDETDPFGSAIHHRGPYEAINAILGVATNGVSASGDQKQGVPRQLNRPVQQVHFPERPISIDPYAPLNLKPGQILARAPIYNPQNLEQTPYHRQHHSISDPYHVYEQQPPTQQASRRHSERQPPHPKHFSQQLQQQPQFVIPPQGLYLSQNTPMLQVDRYPQPPPSKSQVQQQLGYHPRSQRQDYSSPQPHNYPQFQLQRQPPQAQQQYYPEPQPQDHPPPSQLQPSVQPEVRARPQSEHQQLSQPQTPHPTVRVESWSPAHDHPPNPNPYPSSRYDSQRGPVPLHVPKRLVMPSPLHQPNAPLPSNTFPPEPQYHRQQQPTNQLCPTPSQVALHDSNFIPPSATASKPLPLHAEDITMLPDGRKLTRKRTTMIPSSSIPHNAPIPLHVPLPEAPALNPVATMRNNERYSAQGQEIKGREKVGKRLSKRRNDV